MLMVGAETVFVINPTLHAGKLAYDVNEFAPVTGLVRLNQGLLAHPSLPANTIAELIALHAQHFTLTMAANIRFDCFAHLRDGFPSAKALREFIGELRLLLHADLFQRHVDIHHR